jgi:hypothetical protein
LGASSISNRDFTRGYGQFASVSVPAVQAQAAEFGIAFDLPLGYADQILAAYESLR